jgi:hypothetical protein
MLSFGMVVLGFDSRQERIVISSPKRLRPPTSLIQWIPWVGSPGVKRAGHEADSYLYVVPSVRMELYLCCHVSLCGVRTDKRTTFTAFSSVMIFEQTFKSCFYNTNRI